METETTIQEMSGSYYVRIPKILADYMELNRVKGAKTTEKAKIRDISKNKLEITIPVW